MSKRAGETELEGAPVNKKTRTTEINAEKEKEDTEVTRDKTKTCSMHCLDPRNVRDQITFMALLEDLRREHEVEGEGFYVNRAAILGALVDGKLYVIKDTAMTYPEAEGSRDVLSPNPPQRGWSMGGDAVVPSFVAYPDNAADLMLWIHGDYRRRGYGRFAVDALNIRAADVIIQSMRFWHDIGFHIHGHALSPSLVHMER